MNGFHQQCDQLDDVVTVVEWSWSQTRVWSWDRNLIPMMTCHVAMPAEVQSPPIGGVCKLGKEDAKAFFFLPCHLTEAKNYEVHHQ
ncbi:hypothetical protein TNCV_3627361 [Trichonephila clavipes]|nr:hypothetical protein TNCV_3627361 [Trichonephila clavipes]